MSVTKHIDHGLPESITKLTLNEPAMSVTKDIDHGPLESITKLTLNEPAMSVIYHGPPESITKLTLNEPAINMCPYMRIKRGYVIKGQYIFVCIFD